MSFFLIGSISPFLWTVCKLVLYVFCVVDLVLLAVVINIATFAWWRSLAIVRRAELLWDKNPDRAERLCYRVRNRLDRSVRVKRARRLAKPSEAFKMAFGGIFVESALLFVEITDWILVSLEATFKSLRQHIDIPKYHRFLRAVVRFLDEDPWRVGSFSRRACEKCEDVLSHRLVKRGLALLFLPANSTRLSAYALSEVLLAVQQSSKGQHRIVESRLDKIRKRFGRGADADRWLGKFYLACGHISSEAVECYFRLCKSNDVAVDTATVPTAKQRLQVACEIRSGMSVSNLEERLQWNRRAASVIVDQSWPLLGEGLALYGLKRYTEAIAALARTPALFPKCTPAKLWTARCHAAMGDREQAKRQLVRIARGASNDSSELVALAEHFLAIGQTKAAQQLVNKLPLTNLAIKGKLLAIEGKLRLRRGKVEKARRHSIPHRTSQHTTPRHFRACRTAPRHSPASVPPDAVRFLSSPTPKHSRQGSPPSRRNSTNLSSRHDMHTPIPPRSAIDRIVPLTPRRPEPKACGKTPEHRSKRPCRPDSPDIP